MFTLAIPSRTIERWVGMARTMQRLSGRMNKDTQCQLLVSKCTCGLMHQHPHVQIKSKMHPSKGHKSTTELRLPEERNRKGLQFHFHEGLPGKPHSPNSESPPSASRTGINHAQSCARHNTKSDLVSGTHIAGGGKSVKSWELWWELILPIASGYWP